MWDENRITQTVKAQRKFFRTGKTLDVEWRLSQLRKLKKSVIAHSTDIEEALCADLGRSATEGYFCDVGTVITEINEALKELEDWAKPEVRFSGIMCFPSLFTKIYKMPYGVSLIISPFNFPIYLSLGVLVPAIAAGNTAIIKTSSKTPHCTHILEKIIAEAFPPFYVTVVDGGHDVADMCLSQRVDKIFYTGSPRVGVHVLEMAAKNLTPTALELGGENGNWCIVRKDANLKDAARKIAFMKICNSGQICININQIAVASEVADDFLKELKHAILKQIGKRPLENPEYPHLISEAAFDKCRKEAKEYADRIIMGGRGNRDTLRFEPTLIYPVKADEPIVNHELFNPLLPIVPFGDDEIEDLIELIEDREHGLALYIFTDDVYWAEQTMARMQFGGGCINEVCLHMMVKGAPFNGTGHSGMGAYHGKWGFDEFTHPQTIFFGNTRFNLPLREHPYEGAKNKWKKLAVKIFER
ncbi:MAG: aldehyde dehydrogenase family protein [Lachnospiraceae bacterium]|nr:aldehyde dehydrogenase family protein [Lachnospiraceae bacterium]